MAREPGIWGMGIYKEMMPNEPQTFSLKGGIKMEKKEIANRIQSLQSIEDLLQLINEIVKDELGEKKSFKFSIRQLKYYSNPNNIRGRYTHFSIPKKSGGVRCISAPSKGLKNLQYYINIILKAVYKPSVYAKGFCEGQNIVDNAVRHIGQNYVFNTDITDFFPSIKQPRVWKRFQLPPFNFSKPVANLLAGLCCIKEKKDDGSFEYVLPQGAPTSPLITNAICDTLDRRLSGLARRLGLHYSRYADDITFSSMHNVYQKDGIFLEELKKIIVGQGFCINEKKTRLQKRGQRQEVTGLTVSERVNTSRKYVAEIRNLLHIWEKYGYNEVYKRFYPRYKKEKAGLKKGEPMLENVLYGKLQYLKMVKGSKDSVYTALQNRYNNLTSPINGENSNGFDYLRAFTLSEFEEIMDGKISYSLSKTGIVYGHISIERKDCPIFLTNEAKYQLVKNGTITDAELTKTIKKVKGFQRNGSKPDLYVVLTTKNKQAPFWMMTYYDPTFSELELSDIPVSKLLDIWETEGINAAMKAYEESLLPQPASKNDKQMHDHKDFTPISMEELPSQEELRQQLNMLLEDVNITEKTS